MDITPYVGAAPDLAGVARAGGPEVAEAAERLAGGLDLRADSRVIGRNSDGRACTVSTVTCHDAP